MIDGRNHFDKPIINNIGTNENIKNVATDQRNDYTTGFLLDYRYFK